MSDSEREPPYGEGGAPAPLDVHPEGYAPSVAARLARYQRAGGIITPLLTALVAFLMGGIVVLSTGHNPITTYKAIFEGSGLNWFFHFGSHQITIPGTHHQIWFWWDTNTNHVAAYNLTQTLITTTPLILTGLAVAFAYRCGLFNIGGQGQYAVGAIVGVFVGSRFVELAHVTHVLLVIVLASLAGAAWAAIAGFLKATVGAHEVITTIMLNWIAIWVGSWLFGAGGPLQNSANKSLPVSNDIADSAKLPVIWGEQELQGLHIGIFVAVAALVVFWAILNRTTVGYEVRAVGFNPEAAAYGGISVKKNLIRSMAISGAFAGLAGGLDMLGYLYRFGVSDIPVSAVGFLGIAVALLGRNTAIGVGLSALLFGALLFGTTHGLQSGTIDPQLAGNLTYIIQGLIVLFVGADVLILAVWNSRRRLRRRRAVSA